MNAEAGVELRDGKRLVQVAPGWSAARQIVGAPHAAVIAVVEAGAIGTKSESVVIHVDTHSIEAGKGVAGRNPPPIQEAPPLSDRYSPSPATTMMFGFLDGMATMLSYQHCPPQ